jgi:phenylacetate-CoA ligase
MNNFIPAVEKETPANCKKFQESKLNEALVYLLHHSRFYKNLFIKNHIDFQKIKFMEDLSYIPVTTKDQLQQHSEDFLCVPKTSIIDYVTTSGTLGDPVTFALTEHDLERLTYNEYISFICADGHSDDIYQLTTTMDRRFMAGLAYYMGVRKLGAGIVRVGSGIPELQWDTIKRVSPTALIAVPSFILRMIEYAEQHNIKYRETVIKKAVCIGEALRNADFSLTALGQQIVDKWNIKLYSTYASTEMSTSFTECGQGKGGHHHPELIIVEFLDENDNPVPEGEAGEITITTLGVEGMPLLRFKTGDISHRHTEPCKCGRTSMRLGPIIGRKKQMIKYKGTTLYPPAFFNILDAIPKVINYVVEVSTNSIGTDEILIRVGTNDTSDQFNRELKDHFRTLLRVVPVIQFDSVENISKIQMPESGRKPIKFIDKRDAMK